MKRPANKMWLTLASITAACLFPCHGDERVALVVGVDDYSENSGLPGLSNAVKDATLVGNELRGSGFEVRMLSNPNSKALREEVRTLGHVEDIVFYFAGHGIQTDEKNFLLCSDGSVDPESGSVRSGVALGEIVNALGAGKPDNLIVFLDCCRDLAQDETAGRNSLRAGLVLDQYPGVVLCYAASPGSVALDGEVGRNGPFATSVARYIASNAEFTQLIKNVTNEVTIKTGRQQIPFVAGSLGGDFFFRPSDKNVLARYMEQLAALDHGKVESAATAMDSLKELCQAADEPTRSLLIGEFVRFRDRVLERFNSANYKLLSAMQPSAISGVTDLDRKWELGRWDAIFQKAGAWVRHDGEGGGMLVSRPMWLEGSLARVITQDWIEYLAMENKHAESPPVQDALIVISMAELVNRVIEYEEFLIRNYTFPMRGEVEHDLEWHVKVLIYGIDNSPIAPFDGVKARPEYLEAVELYLAKSDPTWQGVVEARSFRELLKKAGDMVTPEIERHASKLFLQRPINDRLELEEEQQAKVKHAARSSSAAGSTGPHASGSQFPGERFPETRTRMLTPADLSRFNLADTQYAINELFARHGAWFPKDDLRQHFARFAWYRPRQGVDFDVIEKEFSEVEKANLLALAARRAELKRRQ